jgi:hypothetical protein
MDLLEVQAAAAVELAQQLLAVLELVVKVTLAVVNLMLIVLRLVAVAQEQLGLMVHCLKRVLVAQELHHPLRVLL